MPIRRIHQIEITSKCNLRCKYCVHPKMTRTKEHMSDDIFIKSLDLVKQCVERSNQTELNLCGIGESTMHPKFEYFLKLAREALPDIKLIIASNAVSVNENHIQACAKYGVDYYVSLHRPEVAGPVIELAKKYNVLRGVSADPSIAAIDWAGQVDWHVSAVTDIPCPWLIEQRVMVTSSGNLTSCCLDGSGLGIIGTVNDDIDNLTVEPYQLCKSCTHSVPNEFKMKEAI